MFRWIGLLLGCMLFWGVQAAGSEFISPKAARAHWIFSGMVSNEREERFGYFFQLARLNNQYEIESAIVDACTGKLVFHEYDKQTMVTPDDGLQWHVGHAFMQFNPINDSWIFGVQMPNKSGFNFKIDMLKQVTNSLEPTDIRPGMGLLVTQTGYLNGHIQLESSKQEQFVTAKNSWFRQIQVLDSKATHQHPMTGALCHFDDGSGLHAMRIIASDASRASVAGWQDAVGRDKTISQFISVRSQDDKKWVLDEYASDMHLTLKNALSQISPKENNLAAGFVVAGSQRGFCVLNQDRA